ncbi:MAG: hypothetical protein AAB510_00315 [Patescibacteria group bacterium]
MSSKDKKDNQYSKKILRILGQKPAISLSEIHNLGVGHLSNLNNSKIEAKPLSDQKYAITRSLKGLREAGLIEQISSPQNDYVRLTKEGKKKTHSLKLENTTGMVSTKWDGYWRIILLDIPEDRKSERESMRYLLKKAGFVCLKNSAWISPYPYEHLFINIKKDLGFTTEIMIIVTQMIDEETKKILLESFCK